jgi:hypothetical protein
VRVAQADQLASVILQIVAGPLGGSAASVIAQAQPFEGPLLGDENGDGVRDDKDVDAVFPDGVGSAEWSGTPHAGALDLDGNAIVDARDAGLFLSLVARDRLRVAPDGTVTSNVPGDLNGDLVVDENDVERAVDLRRAAKNLHEDDRYSFEQWLGIVVQLARLPADPDRDGDWDDRDVIAVGLLTGDAKYREPKEMMRLLEIPFIEDDTSGFFDEDMLDTASAVAQRLTTLFPELAERLELAEDEFDWGSATDQND